MSQTEIQFEPEPLDRTKESQTERCQRLLAGDLRRYVRPASEMAFDYQKASREHAERMAAAEAEGVQ